ncbi:FxsA family protein [Paenibacillus sp. N1-5-1-14]|uniref:FxsA family protein n=1 Tax=Paenibacillus radicibacter TaxID=2972488 RepID=UPI0021596117|nr:FxsA family protein [Paenibacillus radicibacter]MCR8643716.1 FxsA family protein [Paenibacillus radicibacter]
MRRGMFIWLILAPALEILSIYLVGKWIGSGYTFLLLLLSAVFGVYFVKREIPRVWVSARMQLSRGQMPATTILEGLCILVGGIFLLIPGFISDLLGILMLLPFTRPIFQALILLVIRRGISSGRINFFFRR